MSGCGRALARCPLSTSASTSVTKPRSACSRRRSIGPLPCWSPKGRSTCSWTRRRSSWASWLVSGVQPLAVGKPGADVGGHHAGADKAGEVLVGDGQPQRSAGEQFLARGGRGAQPVAGPAEQVEQLVDGEDSVAEQQRHQQLCVVGRRGRR